MTLNFPLLLHFYLKSLSKFTMTKKITTLLFLLITFSYSIFAQFTLLKDINTGNGAGVAINSKPVLHGGKLYFVGHENGYTRSLWQTNGTALGTKNIVPSTTATDVDYLCSSAFKFYFAGFSDGPAVFVANNSAEGATKLKNFDNGKPFDIVPLATNSKAIFGIENFNGIATELWTTNGTAAGTTKLGDYKLANGFMHYFRYKNLVLITEQSTNTNQSPALLTDGTVAGTKKVIDVLTPLVGPIYELQSVVAADDYLFFTIKYEVSPGSFSNKEYVSDGTVAGTKEINVFGNIREVKNVGGKYVLIGENETGVCDSTSKVYTGLGVTPSYWTTPILHKKKVYFHGDDSKIYVSNGTSAGTTAILTLPNGSIGYDPFMYAYGDFLYLNYANAGFSTLKQVNLTNNQSTDFVDFGISGFQLTQPFVSGVNSVLLFARQTTDDGFEIWRFGTPPIVATQEIKVENLIVSPNPTSDFIDLNNEEPFGLEAILTIYSIDGRILKKEQLGGKNKVRCELSGLPMGILLVEIVENGKISQGKIVRI
jgi:trimeric autotransporter adhesin